MLSRLLFTATIIMPALALAQYPVELSTNTWVLPEGEAVESVSFVAAEQLLVDGRLYDDSFWVASGTANLNGKFDNDVWLLSTAAKLSGGFGDHVRVASQAVTVDGVVSNGLWAIADTITTTTNSSLFGQQFLVGNQLTLNGHVEGDVYARGHTITIGGTIVGNVNVYGNDIIIRPGTTVIGDLHYMTTNQTIVLDANSHVSGELSRISETAVEMVVAPKWVALVQAYWFSAAVLIGAPFILMFPVLTGQSVRLLRSALWKCGLTGVIFAFIVPFVIIAAAFTMIGLPLAAVLGAVYGLTLYLGKFAAALAIGTALLGRRGQISVPGALLSLVCGLFLYYSMALFPYVGSSLQTMATAFGAGSMVLAIAGNRGQVKAKPESQSDNTETSE